MNIWITHTQYKRNNPSPLKDSLQYYNKDAISKLCPTGRELDG